MKRILAVVIAAAGFVPATAQNESDWKPYFTFKEVTYYYAPSTLKREGTVRFVKWHDSLNPQVVFMVKIDCASRTIRSLSADQYDLITGDYYETADLSAQPPDDLGTPDSMGAHLAKTVC